MSVRAWLAQGNPEAVGVGGVQGEHGEGLSQPQRSSDQPSGDSGKRSI